MWSRWVAYFLGSDADDHLRRRSKLVSLLTLVGLISVLNALLHLSHGLVSNAAASLLVASWNLALLFALKLGRSPVVVIIAFLLGGCLAASWLAFQNGHEGVRIALWLAIAPLIALTVSGPRAGWIALAFTAVVMTVTIYGVHARWFPSSGVEIATGPTLASALGFASALFFIVRVYEADAERIIRTLEQKNRELDRANRAKSEFVATISHELRTPLNGVIGVATLLRDEPSSPVVKSGLKVIETSGSTLLALISDVLDFAKIESGTLELESAVFAPRELFETSLNAVRSQCRPGVELRSQVSDSVPTWLRGDPGRLRQVLHNLLGNATKFTSSGSIELNATWSDGLVRLAVTDTGIGLSADAIARIRQPFVQIDAGASRAYGGVGLGLAITQRLLDAMQGTLAIDSVSGRGSTFTATARVERTEPPSLDVAASERIAPLTLLVAEDNPVNQHVLTRLLEKAGHRVVLAGDGAAAVERALQDEAIDAVLMDCHMPLLDGFGACAELRRLGCELPIFAVTASVATEDIERCFRVGMNDVLSKPIRVERLTELLRRIPRRTQRVAA
ncbi:MAG: response regulator [Myxococcaceae bacterium]